MNTLHSLSGLVVALALTLALSLPLRAANATSPAFTFSVSSLSLPSGPLSVGDATFTVAPDSVLQLSPDARAPLPLLKADTPLKATRIHFLHTYEPGPGIEDWRVATGLALRKIDLLPDWPVVFSYRVTYADSSTVSFPVRFGEGIEALQRVQTVAPMLWARHHWARELDPVSTAKAVLYAMSVPNPRPDLPIAAIDILPPDAPLRPLGTAHILAFSTTTEPLSGRYLFVQCQPLGTDFQPGTLDQPFGTLQKALDTAQPGDFIFVRGGTYGLNTPQTKRFTGMPDRWLTVSAFPGESPIFDARHLHYDTRQKPYGEGPTTLGNMQHDTGALHFWGDPSYLRVQGLHIHHSRRAALSAHGKPDATSGQPAWASFGTSAHVELNFNTIWQSAEMGVISAQINDITINGNRLSRPHAYEAAYDPVTLAPVTRSEGAQESIDLSRSQRFEIAFNTVAGSAKEAIDTISVEDGRIHHNYLLHSLNGIYIDSWTIPIRRVEVYRNFIQDCFAGIPLATEGGNDLHQISIHHNIVIDSRMYGISVTEATYKAKPASVQGHRVFNNTVHASGAFAQSIGWQSSGLSVLGYRDNPDFRDVTLWNNLVTATHGRPLHSTFNDAPADHAIRFTHNLVWPTAADTTLDWVRENKGWRAEDLVKGENTLVADPLYLDPDRGDFRIDPASPARFAGHKGEDLGALASGQVWIPGLDFAGAVTSYYQGAVHWTPVEIPRALCTQFRNNLQRPAWFQSVRYGADFRNLPIGDQAFVGVTFRIPDEASIPAPSVLTLAGYRSESRADAITGIPVHRPATRLAFLHTAEITPAAAKNGTVFHYRVHYADGSHLDIPVRNNQEIAHWRQTKIQHLPDATTAWTQEISGKRTGHIQLYQQLWTNPKPDLPIATIDILRLPSDALPLAATPAVFAISTGLTSDK